MNGSILSRSYRILFIAVSIFSNPILGDIYIDSQDLRFFQQSYLLVSQEPFQIESANGEVALTLARLANNKAFKDDLALVRYPVTTSPFVRAVLNPALLSQFPHPRLFEGDEVFATRLAAWNLAYLSHFIEVDPARFALRIQFSLRFLQHADLIRILKLTDQRPFVKLAFKLIHSPAFSHFLDQSTSTDKVKARFAQMAIRSLLKLYSEMEVVEGAADGQFRNRFVSPLTGNMNPMFLTFSQVGRSRALCIDDCRNSMREVLILLAIEKLPRMDLVELTQWIAVLRQVISVHEGRHPSEGLLELATYEELLAVHSYLTDLNPKALDVPLSPERIREQLGTLLRSWQVESASCATSVGVAGLTSEPK